jgi:hypothetical protein
MDRTERINPFVSSLPLYNPTGSFIWGLCEGPDSLVELHIRINISVASAKPQMLKNKRGEIEYRLDILQATDSAQTEKY